MEPRLCQNVYIIRSTLHSDPDAQLIAFLTKIGINVTIGDRPVEYLLQLIANQSVISSDSIKCLPDASVTSEHTSDCSDVSRINDSIGANSVGTQPPTATIAATLVTDTTTTTTCTTRKVIVNNNNQNAAAQLTTSEMNGKTAQELLQTKQKTVVTRTTTISTSSSVASINCDMTPKVTTNSSCQMKAAKSKTTDNDNVDHDLSDPPLVIAPSHPSTRCVGNTLFVLGDFRGQMFRQLLHQTQCVIGFTALLYYYREKIHFPVNLRPIHNLCMKNLYICFANLSKKDVAERYLTLLRYMGGCSRRDLNTNKITHLISSKSSGNKYRVAVTCGLPVMSLSWIDFAWENRFDPSFKANAPEVVEKFKLQPFSSLYLAFYNFSQNDMQEIEELTIKNGGKIVSYEDPRCTHLIIDAIPGDPIDINIDFSTINKHIYVVYKEWFWASLEIAGRADESNNNHSFPIPGSKAFHRNSVDFLSESRNLSADLLSPVLDFSSDSILEPSLNESKNIKSPDFKSFSKRRKICTELLQTEKNYLEILTTIVNIFYKPLEDPACKYLLDGTERKIIFGNVPPIYETHEGIYHDLQKVIENWTENCGIGNIFIKYSGALLKAYPLFVNYFENTKETLASCDDKYPRFHAFLKKCQSRPECKRQSLAELLIRPVQRLPSVILLLSDILKNTDKSNPDHKQLKLAIDKIKEVLLHINEDKRKTEGQIAMFDIINDIEECPASLLSANRHFLCKSDAKLILKNENKALPLKGYTLTLFLFNDVLEICKKRSIKRSDSLNQKSNKNNSVILSAGSKQSSKKSYKHIDTLPLEVIKAIYQFSAVQEYQNAITIVTNPTLFGTSRTYRTYPFILDDKETKLELFVDRLCQQISHNPNILIKGTQSEILGIDFEYAELLADKLSKSNFGFAKTKEKITRAFSMRKPSTTNLVLPPANSTPALYTPPPPTPLPPIVSPSPRRLSRAFSSFMNIGSPLTSLARRQMSTTSLNELPDECADGTFSCPTTPAPRKKKCPPSIAK